MAKCSKVHAMQHQLRRASLLILIKGGQSPQLHS